MIKLIDITAALNENTRAFAFFNAETSHFLSFYNREIFHSREDFITCLEIEKDKNSELHIEQYLALIPDSLPVEEVKPF